MRNRWLTVVGKRLSVGHLARMAVAGALLLAVACAAAEPEAESWGSLPAMASTSTTRPPPAFEVFVKQEGGNWDIFQRDLRSGEEVRLTNDPAEDRNPRFRYLDGPPIVFESNRDGQFDIYAMDHDGSDERRLTSSPAEDVNPDWSPVGREIVFTSGRDGDQELYVMNADGSDQRPVRSHP